MLTSKKLAMKPLLESFDGIHLTAYLINRGDLEDLKVQLRNAIDKSREWIDPVLPTDERKKFLEPLNALTLDASIFKHMTGNIGIFRNQSSFRVLNIPVDVVPSCLVATSFHVKPLLKWLQTDNDFLFLGLEKNAVHLYWGNQSSLRHIDSILFPNLLGTKSKQARSKQEEQVFTWINDWIADLTKISKPKLFVAGDPSLVKSLHKRLMYANLIKTVVANEFKKEDISSLCLAVRQITKNNSKKSLENVLSEFRFAEGNSRVKKNIFQIAKAVVNGRVRKLVVTDELNIFGKIDKKSGGLSIHPFDLDHEDDDLLDDLAQMVLSQGGEVIVASRNEIPNGRPILAILDYDEKELERLDEPELTNLY